LDPFFVGSGFGGGGSRRGGAVIFVGAVGLSGRTCPRFVGVVFVVALLLFGHGGVWGPLLEASWCVGLLYLWLYWCVVSSVSIDVFFLIDVADFCFC